MQEPLWKTWDGDERRTTLRRQVDDGGKREMLFIWWNVGVVWIVSLECGQKVKFSKRLSSIYIMSDGVFCFFCVSDDL